MYKAGNTAAALRPQGYLPVSLKQITSGLILRCLLSCRVLKQLRIDFVRRKLHVPNHGTTDKTILDREHVRILLCIRNAYICKLDVQVLVHRMQSTADTQIILQLYNDIFSHKGLEEGVEQHSYRAGFPVFGRRAVLASVLLAVSNYHSILLFQDTLCNF